MTKLITEEYRRLNRLLHKGRVTYGTSGYIWADRIAKLARENDCRTILDYGAGKCTLFNSLKKHISIDRNGVTENQKGEYTYFAYDPAVPGLETEPPACDLVACTDVLEHIEPDLLSNVLADIAVKSEKMAFLVIATRPAKKELSDGRNAHLIVKPSLWWDERLKEHFRIDDSHFDAHRGEVIVEARRR